MKFCAEIEAAGVNFPSRDICSALEDLRENCLRNHLTECYSEDEETFEALHLEFAVHFLTAVAREAHIKRVNVSHCDLLSQIEVLDIDGAPLLNASFAKHDAFWDAILDGRPR